MKRAFTLVELMVVVGIMSFLGVAATGGYSALQRGMAERGAVAAVSSLLKAAKERALVDRAPTVVFCYNRLLRETTDNENAVVVGEAIAVRRSGRITCVEGSYLVDEFMDAVGSYDIIDKGDVGSRKGMRLWKFDDSKNNMKTMRYSTVADALVPLDLQLRTFGGWGEGDPNGNSNMTHIAYAFYEKGQHGATWQAGNGYGFEFATVQLPKNFVFEKDVPVNIGDVKDVRAFYFDPENPEEAAIEIQFCRPDGSGLPKAVHPAGTATSKENQQI